jgi:Rad3-related DNA helicase
MQLPTPTQRTHRVLMSFTLRKGWHICFFECDRNRRQLPRLAFFNSDETMAEFARRAGRPKTLEDRNIFAMIMERGFGEITLELTDEQYDNLRRA